jgi:type IV secretion system protein VirB5
MHNVAIQTQRQPQRQTRNYKQKRNMRLHIITALLVLTGLAPLTAPAQIQGIPTFDASTVFQLQQQYESLKKQYDAITGSYGRGQIGLQESINASSVVPGSWQEVVTLQNKGAFSSRQAYYERLIRTLPAEIFQDPKSRNATSYKMSTDSVRAALAGGDALYAQVQTHLNNLSRMSQQVDTTTNLKDAQDLQNRIAVENGMMQSALGKLNAMNMNLQANMLNQQNQATSANQQYYKWNR